MKKELVISPVDLLKVIQIVELNQEFPAISHLAIAVAETDWAKNYKPKAISSSVVANRITKFNLLSQIKTKPGKKGRQSGLPLSDAQKSAMQAGRGKKVVNQEWIQELRRTTPASYQYVIDRIEKGSLKAVLKMKCLECCNFDTKEIRTCDILSCSLWASKPYN